MAAPQPQDFMANVNSRFEQKILDIEKAQRKADIHYDDAADDLR